MLLAACNTSCSAWVMDGCIGRSTRLQQYAVSLMDGEMVADNARLQLCSAITSDIQQRV